VHPDLDHPLCRKGEAGLEDRFSRPRTTPTRTAVAVEDRIIELRGRERRDPDWISVELGVPARTVPRVLLRRRQPAVGRADAMITRW
jgi:hypothetical protein